MGKKYQHLLSPLKIGNVIVKNRTLYPNAAPPFLQGPENFPAESQMTFYANLAKNGCAIITLAEWSDPDQRKADYNSDAAHMPSFDYSDPAVGNYFSQLADDVHFYGSKLLVDFNVFSGFPPGYSLNGSRGGGPRPPTQPAPREMIQQNIRNFVEKCRRFRAFGYDGYSMRVEGTLAPSGGRMGRSLRDDEYDGSCLENRTRYIFECAAAVKKEFPDWIIAFGIAGEQPAGYHGGVEGYTLDTAIEFAELCEGRIDILQIREKDMCKSHPTGFTFRKGEHDVIRYSEAIKKAGVTGLLLEPVGGFQDPEEMEGYLAGGKCDLIGMARAFIADPEYGVKLYEGRGEDITPCLWCNKCHGTILDDPDPWLSVCSVNPKMGIEHKLGRMVDPVGRPKKVAVVGGGPAGMRTALYAAQRGHAVTLYEKTGRLGGRMLHGDYASFKWPIGDYKAWLIRQLDKEGVQVVLNCAPTPDRIAAVGFDAVVACTGAVPQIPASIEGFADENGALRDGYWFCPDVFGREAELGKNVVIVGGSETGMETAMYLCENGHNVTVLTRQSRVGHDCSRLHYITMAFVGPDPVTGREGMRPAWEAYENLRSIVGVTTRRVEGGKVFYADADGEEHVIETDSVVLCGGMKPAADEALAFAGAAGEFFLAGDCAGAGNLQRVNRQAFSAAMRI